MTPNAERRPGQGAVQNTDVAVGDSTKGSKNLRVDPAVRVRLDSLDQRLDALARCVTACSPSSCACPNRETIAEYHRLVTYVDGVEIIR